MFFRYNGVYNFTLDESDKENIEKRKEKGKQPQKGRRGPRQRENEVQGLPRKLNTSETLNLLTNAQKKRKLDDSVRSDKKREEAMITTPVRTDKVMYYCMVGVTCC